MSAKRRNSPSQVADIETCVREDFTVHTSDGVGIFGREIQAPDVLRGLGPLILIHGARAGTGQF